MRSLHKTIIVMVIMQASKGKSDCGQFTHGRSRRMINANVANRWPWHAAIYHWVDKHVSEYECGGTVISPNAILTAAHCVSKNYQIMAPDSVSVWLGIQNLNVKEDSAKHFEVAKITRHQHYNSSWFDNDIAIIRLKTNATFDNYVQPICLWDASKLSEIVGRNGTVIGWGKTEKGKVSDALRQAVMPVVHHGKCLNSNRPFFGYYLSETNFCAGLRNGTSVCNGDSGASLTLEDNGIYYIRGILSIVPAIEDPTTFEISCDSTQFALFTDVAQYLHWIEEAKEECLILVNCKKPFYTSGKYLVCKIKRIFQIWEHKCKIIFTEITNTDVTRLTIRGGFEAIPDLSDALDKFENLKSLEIPSNNIKVVDGTKFTAFERIERLHLGGNEIAEFEFDTFYKLKNLIELHLNNNKLTDIDQNLFSELSELKVLWLQVNQLKSLPPDLFWNNKKLEILSFASNNLQEIHRNLFSELRELTLLSMNKNELEILQEDLFRNNNKLAKLTVSGNKIKFIHQFLFSELQSLKHLDLNDNALETLPEGLFRNNSKLEKILAADNKIRRIESDFQHLANLEQLDLTGNVCINESLTASSPTPMQEKIWRECKCDIEVQCDDYYEWYSGSFACEIHLNIKLTAEQNCKIIFAESSNTSVTRLSIRGEFDILPDLSDALVKFDNLQVLEVTESKLKVIERTKLKAFSGIKKLRLYQNEINELASDTFDDLKNLDLLGLGNNSLTEIPGDLFGELRELRYLYLERNQLQNLPNGLFRNNEKLEEIWVANNEIKEIHEDVFSELHSLKILNLEGNKIDIMSNGLFRNNGKLENIWARNNEIKEIHEDLLSELHSLKILNLERNKLEILPKSLFRNNEKLENFWGGNNEIKEIHEELFSVLHSLKILNLERNKLEILPKGLFRNNKKLENFWCENNEIKEIHEDLFSELQSLKIVNLARNKLEILPKSLFRNNEKLENFWGGKNEIKEIHEDLFSKLYNLMYLSLERNQLETLPKGLFRNNEKLERIYAEHNQIKKIECEFQHLPNLHSIGLEGNKCINWSCLGCVATEIRELMDVIEKNCH